MRKLTQDESFNHRLTIKKIRRKADMVKVKYENGDITRKKMKASLEEIKQEEETYIRSSKIILYFVQLFKGE